MLEGMSEDMAERISKYMPEICQIECQIQYHVTVDGRKHFRWNGKKDVPYMLSDDMSETIPEE